MIHEVKTILVEFAPYICLTAKTSDLLMNARPKSKDSFYRCQICFAPAVHSNYGVVSCPPCKMFFKRNAQLRQEQLQCEFDGECEININNRHMCAPCRLEKCFLSGMQVELIRGSRFKSNSKRRKKNVMIQSSDNRDQRYQFLASNLLESTPATLSIDQSNLFSHLMLSYDQQTTLSLAERFISEQNILPLKLRFKCASVHHLLASLFAQAQSFFEKNFHFRSLCSHDRSFLLRRQMKYLILLSSSFIVQRSYLFDYPAFNKAIESLFDRVVFVANDLFSFDVPLVKLSLAMMCFSSFDYTIYECIPTHNLTDMGSVVRLQDAYAELIWRYLTYAYDDVKAVKCFSNLVRCLVSVIDDVIMLRERKTFTDMVNVVIDQTEQSFIRNCD